MPTETYLKYNPQRISYFNDALVIHLVDFPIYYIECISERHFIIAGGGGSSKTGVHNQINILELVPTGDSCAAEIIMKYHTPEEIPDAIMTGSLMRDLPIINTRLATGGSQATVYYFDFNATQRTFSVVDYEILNDKQMKTELKSIRYVPGKLFTGSIDGQLTIWNVDKDGDAKSIDKRLSVHTKDIDEIDVDLKNGHLITLSRDEGRCVIWNLKTLKQVQELKRDIINMNESPAAKYNFRSCRYAYDRTSTKNDNQNSFLMLACNPTPKNGPSKLYKMTVANLKNFKSIPVAQDGIMAMTVTLDGKFVATGTRAGSVFIHEVKNLSQIYRVDGAHYNAVTSLEFLSPKPESLSLTNSETCPLLSASIDRRVIMHRPKKSTITTRLFSIMIMVIMLYLVFFFLYKNYI